ncbi:unannotated protein [freshwater metagenome]|uniref:Unannotated protein n=1 Tax=freshwater metagenome TaxID=449393 RepID=A0A6J6RB77_9ZZZZ
MRERECLSATRHVDDENRDRVCRCAEDALGVTLEQGPVDAEREADARGARAAEVLDQTVIATAAANSVLRRLERRTDELERGLAVVVETPHERRTDLVRDGKMVKTRKDAGKVLGSIR